MQTAIQLPSDADATGRNFGAEELENLRQVIESGTLNCTRGKWVKEFEARFAERYGVPYVRAVTSGTAAVHTAIAAIDPQPGDEIITTPITDMGALTPIIYQAAIPVFADVLEKTGLINPASVQKKITARTRGIMVVHIYGQPCDMRPLPCKARETVPGETPTMVAISVIFRF